MSTKSLNPYSNGYCSMRANNVPANEVPASLNPYSNGYCSMSVSVAFTITAVSVLILILMDIAL